MRKHALSAWKKMVIPRNVEKRFCVATLLSAEL
jgi:hypothetical protein